MLVIVRVLGGYLCHFLLHTEPHPARCRCPCSSRATFAGRPGTAWSSSLRGGHDRLGRAEVREQRPLAGRADPGQLVQQRAGHRTVAANAVVGDRKAVGLVADALEQLQLRRGVVEHERRWPPGLKHLLDALGQRDDRDPALAQRAQRPQAGRELSGAAVDHDEAGQRGEARVISRVVRGDVRLALPLGVAALEHLGHRGVVVGHARFQRADAKAPVVGLLRRAALEHDHRGDRVIAAEIGDVEALDPDRRRVQPEHPLQPFERIYPALAATLGAQALGVEREQRVALGQLQHPPLLPALGRADLHGTVAAAGQRGGEGQLALRAHRAAVPA